MAKIKLTKHAKKRLSERDIPDPNKLILKHAGKKLRRIIRENCKALGCNTKDTIYFGYYTTKSVCIFVCKQVDVGKFICLTAFKYLINQNQPNAVPEADTKRKET